MAAAGVYRRTPLAERLTSTTNAVKYFGDTPTGGQGLADREQRRVVFQNARPQFEFVDGVLYTATGMAWRGGALHQSFSVREPSFQEMLRRPHEKAAQTLERGVIVESDFPYSYGDWLHAYLGTVLCALPLDAPLIVPAFLARKSYVARDLAIAGIEYLPANQDARIDRATVLRKQTPLFYWTSREVEAYQARFAPLRAAPSPGSITYFGRFDVPSEVLARRFPSEAAARVVERLGGRVVRQEVLSPRTSPQFAEHVETVIGDHGSGILNILHWRPKTVIELSKSGLWNNNNLFVAEACGVQNFAMIVIDDLDEAALGARIRACLDRFGIGYRR